MEDKSMKKNTLLKVVTFPFLILWKFVMLIVKVTVALMSMIA